MNRFSREFLKLVRSGRCPSVWGGNLDLAFLDVESLEGIIIIWPDIFEVTGNLNLRYTDIRSLPEKYLKVGGDLSLQHTYIEFLPERLEVGGYLDLYKSHIKVLPGGLKVGGLLELRYTSITSLPSDLEVGDVIILPEDFFRWVSREDLPLYVGLDLDDLSKERLERLLKGVG